MWLIVAVVGAAAAGLTVGLTALTSGKDGGVAALQPRAGTPPLALDLGVRIDPEAKALRNAARLYNSGRRAASRPIFARYHSLQARVGLAISRWPDDSLRDVQGSPPLALAVRSRGSTSGSRTSGRAGARRRSRPGGRRFGSSPTRRRLCTRTICSIRTWLRGCPSLCRRSPRRPESRDTSPPRQLAALAAAAARPDARAKLLYGIALQRLGKPLSAKRQYSAAALLEPADPEALVAAAVGSFSKAKPSIAFSRLGPLARRFRRLRRCGSIWGCCCSGSAVSTRLAASFAWPFATIPTGRSAERLGCSSSA